ncbi:hypothetical protein, partial [Vibrio vulnificus]|uniref:hypothetical protein n=1 Tax=Vibrio vulnificus TaxID=672 RepID=UPI001A92A05D
DFPDFNFRKKSAIFYIFWKSVPRRRQAKVSRKVPEWNIKSNSCDGFLAVKLFCKFRVLRSEALSEEKFINTNQCSQ